MKWSRALTYRSKAGKLHIVDDSSGERKAACQSNIGLSKHDWPQSQFDRAKKEGFICVRCSEIGGIK